MANTSISNLTASAALTGAEIVPVVQTGVTVRTTTAAIAALASGGSGTVTSVAASVPAFLSIAGSPITTSGTLAITYSGTALPIANGGTGSTSTTFVNAATNVTGLLPVANGGTGTATPALVAGTNVTISGTWPNQTINASGGGGSGTVTSVAALTLGTTGTDLTSTVANGTTTPVITLNVPTASATNRGVLSTADWTTFNNKGSGTVTSVAASVPAFLSISGSPITSSGTLAITYSGTALPVANGGTGATTSTGSGAVVLATSPTLNNPTITNYTESVVAIGTVTTTNTIALTNGTVQTATLTASTACTFTMPTATAGKSFILLLKQAATTGNGTATFTSVKWPANTAPTITATAGTMDILSFVSDGTNWYGSVAQAYVP